MSTILGKLLLLLLLVLPTTIVFVGRGNHGSMLALAQDSLEGEEDEGVVETDEVPVETEAGDTDEGTAVTDKEGEEAEEEEQPIKPSPNADTYIHFIKPSVPNDIPAGKPVRFLVGFTNKGDKDFLVSSLEASFRYPQDYSFFLQNFSVATYNQVVEPKKQATFEYAFTPSEAFNSRPFGLSILLNYKDSDGTVYLSPVFNETVTVVEPDEGFDGETFFLYVFLVAVAVLLLVGAQQLLASFGVKKRLTKQKAAVEMGTQNADVDYDWLPKETLEGLKRSPGRSPKKSSPRQRRSKRSSGSGEE